MGTVYCACTAESISHTLKVLVLKCNQSHNDIKYNKW